MFICRFVSFFFPIIHTDSPISLRAPPHKHPRAYVTIELLSPRPSSPFPLLPFHSFPFNSLPFIFFRFSSLLFPSLYFIQFTSLSSPSLPFPCRFLLFPFLPLLNPISPSLYPSFPPLFEWGDHRLPPASPPLPLSPPRKACLIYTSGVWTLGPSSIAINITVSTTFPMKENEKNEGRS